MAEPAAPGAHLRSPAEVGGGRRAEAVAGAGQEGRGGGRAACLVWAHPRGGPPHPGTPRSRPREVLEGWGGRCCAYPRVDLPAAAGGAQRQKSSPGKPAPVRNQVLWYSPGSAEREQRPPPGPGVKETVSPRRWAPAKRLHGDRGPRAVSPAPRPRPGRARTRSYRQRQRVRGAAPRPVSFDKLWAPGSSVPLGPACPRQGATHGTATRTPHADGARAGGEAGAGGLGRPSPSPSGPPDRAAAAPGKREDGQCQGCLPPECDENQGPPTLCSHAEGRVLGPGARPPSPPPPVAAQRGRRPGRAVSARNPRRGGRERRIRGAGVKQRHGDESQRAAAGRGRRSAVPSAGSAGPRGAQPCPSPAPRAQRAPQIPGGSVAVRSRDLGRSSQSSLDRQGEFV